MLGLGQPSHPALRTNMIKVFCFFSSEKKTLTFLPAQPPFPSPRRLRYVPTHGQ